MHPGINSTNRYNQLIELRSSSNNVIEKLKINQIMPTTKIIQKTYIVQPNIKPYIRRKFEKQINIEMKPDQPDLIENHFDQYFDREQAKSMT